MALGAALAACFAAQVAKVGLEYYLEKRWDPARLFGTGGMPSSHSAFVTGLASSLGTKHGLGSDIFAVAFVLACVVMYDATGIRQHAGKHASVLNMIITELPPEHPAGRQPERRWRSTRPPHRLHGEPAPPLAALVCCGRVRT